MSDKKAELKKIIAVAISSFLVASIAYAADNKSDQNSGADNMQKCYGIAKKGMNDCQTKMVSCAGSAVKDNQKDAFLFLPKGDCEKIVGGKLSADDSKK